MEVVILTGITMRIGIIPQSVCQGDDVSLTLPFNPSFSPKLGNESGPRLRLPNIPGRNLAMPFDFTAPEEHPSTLAYLPLNVGSAKGRPLPLVNKLTHLYLDMPSRLPRSLSPVSSLSIHSSPRNDCTDLDESYPLL